MRIKLYSGRIVKLKHFEYRSVHVDLLKRIIHELPNLKLEATLDSGVSLSVTAFDLNIESEYDLRMLNPHLSLAK